MERLKKMATEDEEDPAEPLRRHIAQVRTYREASRLLREAPVAHETALRYVSDLKAALRSALGHHDTIRRELTTEQAATYNLRQEIERHHQDAAVRAKQLQDYESELKKTQPMEQELRTLRASHQSLRAQTTDLEHTVATLQQTNAEWAEEHQRNRETVATLKDLVTDNDRILNTRSRLATRALWKLVQISQHHRDLLTAYHGLQDTLRRTQKAKKRLRNQAVVRIITVQLQMRQLRQDLSIAEQQVAFYRTQHPDTPLPEGIAPTTDEDEDEVDTTANDDRLETLPYQEDEADSEDDDDVPPLVRPTYDFGNPLPYDPAQQPEHEETPEAIQAQFVAAANALRDFFDTLPNNLRGGASPVSEAAEEEPHQVDAATEPQHDLDPAPEVPIPTRSIDASHTVNMWSRLVVNGRSATPTADAQVQTVHEVPNRPPLQVEVISDDDESDEEPTHTTAGDNTTEEGDQRDSSPTTSESEDPYSIPQVDPHSVATNNSGPTDMESSPARQ